MIYYGDTYAMFGAYYCMEDNTTIFLYTWLVYLMIFYDIDGNDFDDNAVFCAVFVDSSFHVSLMDICCIWMIVVMKIYSMFGAELFVQYVWTAA